MHPRTAAVPALTVALLATTWTSAVAGGSDAEPPYAVTPTALVLPGGDTLGAHDHVNVRYALDSRGGSANLHIEPGTSSARFIGDSSVTWVEVGVPRGACITWVQVSGYDEHFGEGRQQPVCTTNPSPTPTREPSPQPSRTPDCTPKPTPTPTDKPTDKPTPTPTPYLPPPPRETTPPPTAPPTSTPTPSTPVTPSAPPSSTPTPSPTTSPSGTPTPTPSPSTPTGVDEPTGTPTPTPSQSAQVLGPTPSPSESVDSEVLADTPGGGDDTLATTGGSPAGALGMAVGALAIGAGFVAARARTRHHPAHRRG